MIKKLLTGISFLTMSLNPVMAATIDFSSGGADWTFYYDSVADRFDVVFRTKSSGTTATGLTDPYAGYSGIVGGSADDYNYSALNVLVSNPGSRTINSISFHITPRPDSSVLAPDLGFRSRFREELTPGNVQDQFDALRLTLDVGASTLPPGAEFVMFTVDSFNNVTTFFATASEIHTHDFSSWGHGHYSFGFSEQGEYNLVFNMEGVGGLYSGATGVTELNFSVVPEPAVYALGLGLAVLLVTLYRRRSGETN